MGLRSIGILAVVLTCIACGDDARPPPARPDTGPGRDACAECPSGATCVAGACTCDAPLSLCDGACIDVQSSSDHCGSCENACAAGVACRGGRCACEPPLSVCTDARGDEQCADLGSDTSHCGTCGNRCAAGATCASGVCACDVGEMACTNADGRTICASLMTSVLHCGACGNRCGVGAECTAGACVCPAGRVACSEAGEPDRCADLSSDDSHCGRCGARCLATEVCYEGTCVDACPVGTGCTTAADCRGVPASLPDTGGTFCITQYDETVTAGETTWMQTAWSGGYCIDHYGAATSAGACDPGRRDSCDTCSRCVPVGNSPTLGVLNACMRRCDPGLGDWRTTSGGCRPGYACDLTSQLCLPGCTSDEECRSAYVDLNGNFIREPGETTLDPTNPSHCDRATGRCIDKPFDPAARIGGACTTNAECPADGLCITTWPGGGYCTRIACDLPGRECEPEGGACLAPWGETQYGLCLDACTVGDETNMATIVGSDAGDPDCRVPGYKCQSLDGSALGGCTPGVFNDIVEPNVGAECTDDAECWSPYGNGGCFRSRGLGFCTVTQCGLPPFAVGDPGQSVVCPPGTICEGDPTFYTFCVPTCDPALGAAACREGYVCSEMGEPDAHVCMPACRDVSDCFPGDVCDAGICHD